MKNYLSDPHCRYTSLALGKSPTTCLRPRRPGPPPKKTIPQLFYYLEEKSSAQKRSQHSRLCRRPSRCGWLDYWFCSQLSQGVRHYAAIPYTLCYSFVVCVCICVCSTLNITFHLSHCLHFLHTEMVDVTDKYNAAAAKQTATVHAANLANTLLDRFVSKQAPKDITK